MPFQMSGYLPSSILPSVVWHGLAWLGGGTFSRVRATVILRYFFEVFFKPAILCFYVVVYGDLHKSLRPGFLGQPQQWLINEIVPSKCVKFNAS